MANRFEQPDNLEGPEEIPGGNIKHNETMYDRMLSVARMIHEDEMGGFRSKAQQGPWSLDEEQIAALRVRAENISPEERERFIGLVRQANEDFVDSYGKFMSDPEGMRDCHKRVIFSDTPIQLFLEEAGEVFSKRAKRLWEKKAEEERRTGIGLSGAHMSYWGNLILINLKDKRNLAELIYDTWKPVLNNRFGDKERSINEVTDFLMRRTATHEIAHMCSGEGLERWFGEAGAHYYASRVKNRLGFDTTVLEPDFWKFYALMVNRIGDDVHAVYFGTIENEDGIERINRFVDLDTSKIVIRAIKADVSHKSN